MFGDDIDCANISTYLRGVIDDDTPNIDRLTPEEGLLFTDYYAEQRCIAG